MSSYPLKPGLAAVALVLLLSGCSGATPMSSAQSGTPTAPEPARSTGVTLEGESIELPTGPRTTTDPAPTTWEPSPEPASPAAETSTPDDDEDDDKDEAGSEQGQGSCNGDVTVDQVGEIRHLTGQCGTVTVTATSVILNIEAAEKVVVLAGSSNVTAEQASRVEVLGNSNIVNLDSVGDVVIDGNYNTVTMQHRSGSLRDNGSLNIVNG